MSNDLNVVLPYAQKHLRFGWWSLLVFLTLGFVLETMHGFKVRFYLDVANETRRLMWTLAHAHGTLLSVVHIVFGLCLYTQSGMTRGKLRLVSSSLVGSSFLLPGGFFLGGVMFYSGDPGLGILILPIGAALLGIAVFFMAWSTATIGFNAAVEKQKGDRP